MGWCFGTIFHTVYSPGDLCGNVRRTEKNAAFDHTFEKKSGPVSHYIKEGKTEIRELGNV